MIHLGKKSYRGLILIGMIIPMLWNLNAALAQTSTISDSAVPTKTDILMAIKQASDPTWIRKEIKNGPLAKGNWYGMLATSRQWYPDPHDRFYDKQFSPTLFKHLHVPQVIEKQPYVIATYDHTMDQGYVLQYVGYEGSKAYWKIESVDPHTGKVLSVLPYLLPSGAYGYGSNSFIPSLSSVPIGQRNRGLTIHMPPISTKSMTYIEKMNAKANNTYISDLYWAAGARLDVVPFPDWNPNWNPQSTRTTIQLAHQPNNIALSTDGHLAVVGYTHATQISIVNFTTDQVLHTVQLPSQASEIQLTPDGNTAVISDGNQNVDLVNVKTGAVKSVALGQWITSVNILPSGAYALMTTGDSTSGQVVELSLQDDKIVYQHPLDFSPDAAVLSSSGNTLLMTGSDFNGQGYSTENFDVSKAQVTSKMAFGGQQIQTALNGNVLIMDRYTSGNRYVTTLWISNSNQKVARRINLNFDVMSMALSRDGHFAVLVRGANNTFTATVLNVNQSRIEKTVPVGSGSQSVCIAPNPEIAIVGNSNGTISLIHLGNNPVLTSTLNTLNYPYSVATDSNGSLVVVLNQNPNSLIAFNLTNMVAVSSENALAAERLYGYPFASVVDTYTNPPWIPDGVPYILDEWLASQW